MDTHRPIEEYLCPAPALFLLPIYVIKTHVRNFRAGGSFRLVEAGTRGTLLRNTTRCAHALSCYVTIRITHVCVIVRSGIVFGRDVFIKTRLLISQARARSQSFDTHRCARTMRCFLFLFRRNSSRRHVKEINRGMRPPRRIFTRLRGEREARLLNIF